jgi:hypothetical protein
MKVYHVIKHGIAVALSNAKPPSYSQIQSCQSQFQQSLACRHLPCFKAHIDPHCCVAYASVAFDEHHRDTTQAPVKATDLATRE